MGKEKGKMKMCASQKRKESEVRYRQIMAHLLWVNLSDGPMYAKHII